MAHESFFLFTSSSRVTDNASDHVDPGTANGPPRNPAVGRSEYRDAKVAATLAGGVGDREPMDERATGPAAIRPSVLSWGEGFPLRRIRVAHMNLHTTLDDVRHYDGDVLQSTRDLKTGACCPTEAMPISLRTLLADVHPELTDWLFGGDAHRRPRVEASALQRSGYRSAIPPRDAAAQPRPVSQSRSADSARDTAEPDGTSPVSTDR